jgi:hypothetical protein
MIETSYALLPLRSGVVRVRSRNCLLPIHYARRLLVQHAELFSSELLQSIGILQISTRDASGVRTGEFVRGYLAWLRSISPTERENRDASSICWTAKFTRTAAVACVLIISHPRTHA